MEKFEKILSLFIKNPYNNIKLSEEYKEKKSKFILGVIIVSLTSLFFNGLSLLIFILIYLFLYLY